MDYILQKELHERSLSLLELREKAVKRRVEAEMNMINWDHSTKWQRMQSFYDQAHYEWRVKVCTRSLSFIEGVYERHIWKMHQQQVINDITKPLSLPKSLYIPNHSAGLVDDFNVRVISRSDFTVEPVGVSYEETYSPRSIGYQ